MCTSFVDQNVAEISVVLFLLSIYFGFFWYLLDEQVTILDGNRMVYKILCMQHVQKQITVHVSLLFLFKTIII